jgi:hypothetical protein
MAGDTVPMVFGDVKVIGESPAELIAAELRDLGDPETAEAIDKRASKAISDDFIDEAAFLGFGPKSPWEHTAHQFGYIAPVAPGTTDLQPIKYPGNITPMGDLRQIDIRLNRLRVYDYPGRGMHNILCSFAARNEVASGAEQVTFSQAYSVQEGESAGVAGYPIFIGLNVGQSGVAFECSTLNVSNDADEAILTALGSSTFHAGLNLLTTAQPVVKPFTELTLGVLKAVAARNRKVYVQRFYLGLDFDQAALGIRLTEGNYIAVQAPSDDTLKWNDWGYDPETGAIVNRGNGPRSIPYNYVVFSVSRHPT